MKQNGEIRVIGARLYLLPVETRVPLKFGAETLTSVTCARVSLTIEDRHGKRATGWGETPLSVQWGWPSAQSYVERHSRLVAFCAGQAAAWAEFDAAGHPLEIGSAFLTEKLPALISAESAGKGLTTRNPESEIPWLAALICTSPYDIALHDAYGKLREVPTYATYTSTYLPYDLLHFFGQSGSDRHSTAAFAGRCPADYLCEREDALTAWHLVGGLDPLDESELTGNEPQDGYPITLVDWIRRDGLTCLKIKLRGTDADWDYSRIVRVGRIAAEHASSRNGPTAQLSVDFNCTVTDPAYVVECLDRLERNEPAIYRKILYVEQPFPYDLDRYEIDVREVARRKPLFMDESAHDWRHIRLGYSRGWNGVALKTCKTQTGAILSLCWARAHGMDLMVQDLTNPMLAQIPHVLLAAHGGTILGVETNAMQFYPDASRPEAAVHPGLYTRRNGRVELETIRGAGFGYRLDEIDRVLPEPTVIAGDG